MSTISKYPHFELRRWDWQLGQESERYEQMIQADQAFFARAWEPQSWQQLWPHHERFELFWLQDQQGELMGLALFMISASEQLAHLLKLLIVPKFRRQGLGRIMLTESWRWLSAKNMRKLFLEVEAENLPAIELYKSLNLQVINRIPHFYGPGQQALVMMREDPQ